MRILHAILSEAFYGSERHCIDLAVAQQQAGHDVSLLIADGRSHCAGEFRRVIAASRAAGPRASCVRLIVLPRRLPRWLQRPAAAMLLARNRPEIVHTHLNPAARRVGAVAQRLGIPHVMTLHLDYDPREHAGIDGLVALHARQRAQVPADFAGAVAIVWNWLAGDVAHALANIDPGDVARLRADWRADAETVVFGTVGRLNTEKGMDVLVRAFRRAFPASDAPVRLVIVGDGPQRRAIDQLAGGDPRILLLGMQPDVAPFYRAFDVFVSAARFEPFSLAIIEAMAAGCPLIATRIFGTMEFVTDPRTLWTAPDRDDELAAQLCAAAARKRQRFGYDMSRFSPARAVAETDAFYRRVASRR